MKFLVLRQRDERSSNLCQRIEQIAYSNGGLEFPFTLDGMLYSKEDAVEHVERMDSSYYTHLFHENCRCHLIPVSEENSVSYDGIDEVDESYILHGVGGYTGMLDFESENESPDDTLYDMYASFYSNL
jgi:hypothetical protein